MRLIKSLSVAIALFSFSGLAEAKRGCCSHHGGVCAGQCCDGTELSAKCGGGDNTISMQDYAKTKAKAKQKKKSKKYSVELKSEEAS